MAEEVDVGMKCIKYMLFVANFMFVMIGFLLISIGSTVKAIYGDFDVFIASHYFSPAILAIVIGIIIFFVAIFGCVGAAKESTCLINLFGFFLTVLLIMEIAAAITAYAVRGKITPTIREEMEFSFDKYLQNDADREMWDFTQSRLGCCGIDSPSDWFRLIAPPTFPSIVDPVMEIDPENLPVSVPSVAVVTPSPLWTGPSSCCRGRSMFENGTCLSTEIWTDGCLDELSHLVSESSLLMGCGALAVAFIQMLGVIFACMLAKAVRRLKTQELVERDQNRQNIYEQLARGKDENPAPVLYTPTFSEA